MLSMSKRGVELVILFLRAGGRKGVRPELVELGVTGRDNPGDQGLPIHPPVEMEVRDSRDT